MYRGPGVRAGPSVINAGRFWIIGRGTPKTSSGVTPINVKVRKQGKVSAATLDLIFGVAGVSRTTAET